MKRKHETLIAFFAVFMIFATAPAWALLQVKSGKKTVTTAGTAVALTTTDTYYYDLTVCAGTANTGVVALGPQNVVASATQREGLTLYAGSCHTLQPHGDNSLNGNLKELYVDSTASSDIVNILYRQAK